MRSTPKTTINALETGLVGVEVARVPPEKIADELKQPTTPQICKQQANETPLQYALFQKWLLAPIKEFKARGFQIVHDSKAYDCSDLAVAHQWHLRAQAFDIAQASQLPDLMVAMTSYAPIMAMGALLKSLSRPDAKPGDVIRAAAEILDRTGYGKTIKIPVPAAGESPEDMSTSDLITIVRKRLAQTAGSADGEPTNAEPKLLEAPNTHPQLLEGVYLPNSVVESILNDDEEDDNYDFTPPIA